MEGRIEADAGNDVAAIRAFERAARHDPDFLHEVLPPLLAAYERTGDAPGARNILSEMSEDYRGMPPVLALARLVEDEAGGAAARTHPALPLHDRPSVRGEAALLALTLQPGARPGRTPAAHQHT